MKNGKKQGVRIKRIRCRSVLKDAGFKNGDVVLAVNNTPVDSYPKVLRAYLKVKRTDNRLTVKGSPQWEGIHNALSADIAILPRLKSQLFP